MKKTILTLAVLAFAGIGCSEKEAKEALVGSAHQSSKCPQELRGQLFDADNITRPVFIEFVSEGDDKMALNFSGVEVAVLDGNKHIQRNGSELTASCVNDGEIKVAGSTKSGKTLMMTIRKAQDGGIQLDIDQPERVTVHYNKTGAAVSTFDRLVGALTGNAIDENVTGIPASTDLR